MKMLPVIFCTALLYSCSPAVPGADIPLERQRSLADALADQLLYEQAVTEYQIILERYKLDFDTRSEINFTIGEILFDQLNDYSNALAYYSKIQHLFPESTLNSVAQDRIVACLERLGRSAEAMKIVRESEAAADEESPFISQQGDTIAVVDGKVLVSGEFNSIFNYYYNLLPAEQRGDAPTREHKLVFLRDYLRNEVLFNSAKRRGLADSQEFKELQFLRMKDLLVQSLLQTEVYNKVTIENSEIEEYYRTSGDILTQANSDGSKSKPTIEEARDFIRQILMNQKSQGIQEQLTDQLIEAQDAQIYLDNVQ